MTTVMTKKIGLAAAAATLALGLSATGAQAFGLDFFRGMYQDWSKEVAHACHVEFGNQSKTEIKVVMGPDRETYKIAPKKTAVFNAAQCYDRATFKVVDRKGAVMFAKPVSFRTEVTKLNWNGKEF